ncbi:tryptophan-rich sensory protein [Brevibacterium sp. BRM-1]|uniref:TspO/MBR family protein n=1 Tax=Brevibacterium sp. BRM-1 TaxID=2999062 RepID=UPI0022803375|nr:TspO/MBR family protein [Brevibacterium sp. BRM-1]WAL40506.1 tryptophan-rich sensory protein [Brevibacterium sp. BRM-1]
MSSAAAPVHRSTTPPTGRSLLALLGFGAAVLAAAVIGGLASGGSQQVYSSLKLPAFAPPGWLFGPAWALFYALIALAGWLVWRHAGFDSALWVWTAQLVLNAAWTPLFFAAGIYWLAFAEIALLWVVLLVCIGMFWRRSRPASLLMLPYLAWVTFAAALNLAIAVLN